MILPHHLNLNLYFRTLASLIGIMLFAVFPLIAEDAQPEKDLGFGYVLKDSHIHFIGGESNGKAPGRTRIDTPDNYVINGFRTTLGHKLNLFRSVDTATFKPLSEEYAIDKNSVFYKWISPGHFLIVELQGADPASFNALNLNYATDKNAIWYLDRKIKNSDPTTATLIDHNIIKDSRFVYQSGQKKPAIDASAFRKISGGNSAYYIDSKNVFWGTSPIPGADLESFSSPGNSFMARDKNHVYLSGMPRPGLDPESIKLMLFNPYGFHILSDKNGLYLNDRKFLLSQPGDFTEMDGYSGHSHDRKYLYFVDPWVMAPITVFRKDGSLIAKANYFPPGSTTPSTELTAAVSPQAMEKFLITGTNSKENLPSIPNQSLNMLNRPDNLNAIHQSAIQFFLPDN